MNYPAATLALGPFCFLQGHYVRRITPQLPEPPGAREGIHGDGPPLRLLIVGDSAAAGVGASRQEEGLAGQLVTFLSQKFRVSWQLVAKTGATTEDALHRLNKLKAEAFDVVVTSLGVNDLTAGRQRWVWLKQQSTLIDLLNSKFSARLILLSGLPPMHLFPSLPQPLRWYMGLGAKHFNAGLHQLIQKHDHCAIFSIEVSRQIDGLAIEGFGSDGFHPGPVFYTIWARHLTDKIISRFNAQPANLEQ